MGLYDTVTDATVTCATCGATYVCDVQYYARFGATARRRRYEPDLRMLPFGEVAPDFPKVPHLLVKAYVKPCPQDCRRGREYVEFKSGAPVAVLCFAPGSDGPVYPARPQPRSARQRAQRAAAAAETSRRNKAALSAIAEQLGPVAAMAQFMSAPGREYLDYDAWCWDVLGAYFRKVGPYRRKTSTAPWRRWGSSLSAFPTPYLP